MLSDLSITRNVRKETPTKSDLDQCKAELSRKIKIQSPELSDQNKHNTDLLTENMYKPLWLYLTKVTTLPHI